MIQGIILVCLIASDFLLRYRIRIERVRRRPEHGCDHHYSSGWCCKRNSTLFATIGELFAESSGVLNLGVEGMMLIGAMSAFSIAVKTGNPWLGLLAAMLAAGLLSQIHAFITIHAPGRSGGQRVGSDFSWDGYQPGAR